MSSQEEKSKIQEKPRRTGAADKVMLRNRFLYIGYRRQVLIFMASLVLCGLSVASSLYFSARSTPPIFLPATVDGKVIPSAPMDQSTMPEEMMNAAVSQWVFDAAMHLFTFDYINYPVQIQKAASFFTVRGWNSYLEQFKATNNMETVQALQMIVSIEPKGPPEIRDTGIREGRKAWLVEFPIEIRYTAHGQGKSGFTQTGKIKAVVLRVSTVDSPKGIGIDQYIFEESRSKK